ncbi:hypothetical protein DSO57_1028646 [Entomophthora muscae]|uniref:Uncharacterized protein n=1 Tax=Entomophthora muscae TaxID=34485 RepID=A0ACC2ULA8_9FUNG|nr:hypothetical protein DSO57_1028646 [Entomophthora muscae]
MKLPKTPLMESLGYKWLFWIFLTTMVFASVSIGSRTDSGTTTESQFLDSSWRRVIPGIWYTATPLSNNPPVREETKIYCSTTQVTEPQVFRPLALAFLLCYLGVYFFLGRFNPLLGRYQIFGELFHLGMVSLPVGSLVMGLNPSAIIHHLGRLITSGWVPDNILVAGALENRSSRSIVKTTTVSNHILVIVTVDTGKRMKLSWCIALSTLCDPEWVKLMDPTLKQKRESMDKAGMTHLPTQWAALKEIILKTSKEYELHKRNRWHRKRSELEKAVRKLQNVKPMTDDDKEE